MSALLRDDIDDFLSSKIKSYREALTKTKEETYSYVSSETHLVRMAALIRAAEEQEQQLEKSQTELQLWKAAAKVAEKEKSGESSIFDDLFEQKQLPRNTVSTRSTAAPSKFQSHTVMTDSDSWKELHSKLEEEENICNSFKLPEKFPSVSPENLRDLSQEAVECSFDDQSTEGVDVQQWTAEDYQKETEPLSNIQNALSDLFGGVEFSKLTGKISNPHRDAEHILHDQIETEEEVETLRRVRRGISTFVKKERFAEDIARNDTSDMLLNDQLQDLTTDIQASLQCVAHDAQEQCDRERETIDKIRMDLAERRAGSNPPVSRYTNVTPPAPNSRVLLEPHNSGDLLDGWASRAMDSLLSSPPVSSIAPATPNLQFARTPSSACVVRPFHRDPSPASTRKDTPPQPKRFLPRAMPPLSGTDRIRAEQYHRSLHDGTKTTRILSRSASPNRYVKTIYPSGASNLSYSPKQHVRYSSPPRTVYQAPPTPSYQQSMMSPIPHATAFTFTTPTQPKTDVPPLPEFTFHQFENQQKQTQNPMPEYNPFNLQTSNTHPRVTTTSAFGSVGVPAPRNFNPSWPKVYQKSLDAMDTLRTDLNALYPSQQPASRITVNLPKDQ